MAGKKKPTELKILKGTARKSRLLPNEIQPKKVEEYPMPPDFLEEEAQKEWHVVVPQLKEIGLLAYTDMSMLTSYCIEMGNYFKHSKELKTTGVLDETANGTLIQHPLVGIKNKCLENARKMATEFGFTPRSRTGIGGPQKQDYDPLEDMQKILNG